MCREQPVQFLWVQAQQQPTFTSTFLPPATELPAAVLLAPRKLRFSRLQGAFTQDALSAFINRVASAQLATAPLQQLPVIVDGGEGAAIEAEAVEEEFDLADVMGTAVDAGAEDRAQQLKQARTVHPLLAACMQSLHVLSTHTSTVHAGGALGHVLQRSVPVQLLCTCRPPRRLERRQLALRKSRVTLQRQSRRQRDSKPKRERAGGSNSSSRPRNIQSCDRFR